MANGKLVARSIQNGISTSAASCSAAGWPLTTSEITSEISGERVYINKPMIEKSIFYEPWLYRSRRLTEAAE